MTELFPLEAVSTAAAGITNALGFDLTIASVRKVIPGFNMPLGFPASTHTSMVVLPGSNAGLICVIVPDTGVEVEPGMMRFAERPACNTAASCGETWAFAIILEMSITV